MPVRVCFGQSIHINPPRSAGAAFSRATYFILGAIKCDYFFGVRPCSGATQEMTPGTTFKLHFQLDICRRLCVSPRPSYMKHGRRRCGERKFRGTICRADINYFTMDILFHNRVQRATPSPCTLLIAGRYHRIWIIVFPPECVSLWKNNCRDAT